MGLPSAVICANSAMCVPTAPQSHWAPGRHSRSRCLSQPPVPDERGALWPKRAGCVAPESREGENLWRVAKMLVAALLWVFLVSMTFPPDAGFHRFALPLAESGSLVLLHLVAHQARPWLLFWVTAGADVELPEPFCQALQLRDLQARTVGVGVVPAPVAEEDGHHLRAPVKQLFPADVEGV